MEEEEAWSMGLGYSRRLLVGRYFHISVKSPFVRPTSSLSPAYRVINKQRLSN